MANEFNIQYLSSQNMEAGLYSQGWTQQGSNIAMSEVSAGKYTASMPGSPIVALGVYHVLFENASAANAVIGRGEFSWDGTAEIQFTVEEVLQGSGETVDDALSRLDNIDVDVATNIPTSIAALNDISVADILAAALASGDDVDTALSRLDNVDSDSALANSQSAANGVAIAALNDISVGDILTAILTSGDDVDTALSRLDNIDVDVATNIPASISALNDISVADILAAALTSGDDVDTALSRLDNIDVDVALNIPVSIATLNDISVGDILTAILTSGDDVDTALGRLPTLTTLDSLIRGGRDIDFTGNDTLGWQRIERDDTGTEVARYNLFDDSGSRITDTVSTFLSAGKMISSEVLL